MRERERGIMLLKSVQCMLGAAGRGGRICKTSMTLNSSKTMLFVLQISSVDKSRIQLHVMESLNLKEVTIYNTFIWKSRIFSIQSIGHF